MKQRNKKVLLGIGIFLILIVGMIFVWSKYREKPVEGAKAIRIEVVDSKNQSELYELNTDVEYLKEAMEEAKDQGLTFESEDGDYGLMVTTVNGERAIYAEDGAYWSFYVNEEYCNYGISEQPVEDGDAFKIVYTKAE